MTRLTGLAILAAGFGLGGFVTSNFSSAYAQIKPGTIKEGVKLPSSLEVLSGRVDALEERLNAKIAALENADKVLDKSVTGVRTENGLQQLSIDRLNFEMVSPSGQQGLKKKLVQKGGWDRLSNNAYFVYYER